MAGGGVDGQAGDATDGGAAGTSEGAAATHDAAVKAPPEAPKWAEAAPSGPGRAAGAFEAQARLTVGPKWLLFRALREEEVERDEHGVARLRGGKLRPKRRESRMSMAEAVREGSIVHDSRVVHVGKSIATAVYFTPTPAEARAQRGPRRAQRLGGGARLGEA